MRSSRWPFGMSGMSAAAVITTSGTAVANLMPACVEADHGAIPLLLIHTFLQTLTSDLMDHFEMVTVHFSDLVASIRATQRSAVQEDAARQRRKGPELRIVKPSGETVSV